MTERALASARAGSVLWECGGNPENEFLTTFFDTDPQTARVERGDTSEIFVQTPVASGVRFEGEDGRWFWNRGDSATFVWPRTDTLRCGVRAR